MTKTMITTEVIKQLQTQISPLVIDQALQGVTVGFGGPGAGTIDAGQLQENMTTLGLVKEWRTLAATVITTLILN